LTAVLLCGSSGKNIPGILAKKDSLDLGSIGQKRGAVKSQFVKTCAAR